jgi:putative ABC transport system permease protein
VEYPFLASYVLILIALWYSQKEGFGLEKQIINNSLLAMVQLALLGYALLYIFEIQNTIFLFALLLAMTLFGAFTAKNRSPLGKNGFKVAFLTLASSSGLVFISMLSVGVIHLLPHEMIPIGGMIIGNALNVYTQTIERFKGEVANTIESIEGEIALGATLKQALQNPSRTSVKSAMIPTLNMLQTVGIIHIPGITVGMLLAGADPLKAVSYQIAIMYMMVAVSLLTGYFTTRFGYKYIISTLYEKGRG